MYCIVRLASSGADTYMIRLKQQFSFSRLLSLYALNLLFATTATAEEAYIAVATNFKHVIEELEYEFEQLSEHNVIVTSGSTGKLYAQIMNSAPFDVFLSADQERALHLEESEFGIADSRFTYAEGRIVLWDPAGSPINISRLSDGAYRRIAIANPELAPYGAAALEVLSSLGIASAPQAKLVIGENIGQAYLYVLTRNAEIGFVALSQVLALPAEKQGSIWEPPQDLYAPIRQDAVLLKRGATNSAAIAFIEFLKSDKAAAIIHKSGYTLDDTP